MRKLSKSIYEKLERVTANGRINYISMVSSIIFCAILLVCAIVFTVVGAGNPIALFVTSICFLLLFFLWSTFDKIRSLKDALSTAEKYIAAMEEENTEYKIQTDILLNDKEIMAIMNRRWTAQKQGKVQS